MKEIGKRIWNEPSVAIGLLATLALLAGAFITGTDWGWEAIVAILAPLLSGLGIRPLVTPTAKDEPKTPVVVQTTPATDADRARGF